MSLINSLDDIKHAYYINLDHREDRKHSIEFELSKMDWSAERFSAIKHDNGAIGCFESHIKCLEIALERGWDHVLICEDDLEFIYPDILKNNLDIFLKKEREKDWDVVLLAGNNLPPSEKEDDYSIRIRNCQTTSGYIVNKHYIKILLDKWKEGIQLLIEDPYNDSIYALDMYWKKLQLVDYWYLIVPLSAVQKPSYSDVQKIEVDYTSEMLDLKL